MANILEGTWKVLTVLPVPQVPPHIVFSTFTAGGGVVNSPIIYPPPPFATVSTAHGNWKQTGPREFTATFVSYGFDAAGKAIGTFKVVAVHQLTDRDTFVGTSRAWVCDLNVACGAPTPSLATFTGTRLAVESFSAP